MKTLKILLALCLGGALSTSCNEKKHYSCMCTGSGAEAFEHIYAKNRKKAEAECQHIESTLYLGRCELVADNE